MTSNKSLDEIKEELAEEHLILEADNGNAEISFREGFTACQALTIDRREVRKLLDAKDLEIQHLTDSYNLACEKLKNSMAIVEAAKYLLKPGDGNVYHELNLGFEKIRRALESFYSHHEDMRGK